MERGTKNGLFAISWNLFFIVFTCGFCIDKFANFNERSEKSDRCTRAHFIGSLHSRALQEYIIIQFSQQNKITRAHYHRLHTWFLKTAWVYIKGELRVNTFFLMNTIWTQLWHQLCRQSYYRLVIRILSQASFYQWNRFTKQSMIF